jgi:hypothetical protein
MKLSQFIFEEEQEDNYKQLDDYTKSLKERRKQLADKIENEKIEAIKKDSKEWFVNLKSILNKLGVEAELQEEKMDRYNIYFTIDGVQWKYYDIYDRFEYLAGKKIEKTKDWRKRTTTREVDNWVSWSLSLWLKNHFQKKDINTKRKEFIAKAKPLLIRHFYKFLEQFEVTQNKVLKNYKPLIKWYLDMMDASNHTAKLYKFNSSEIHMINLRIIWDITQKTAEEVFYQTCIVLLPKKIIWILGFLGHR